MHPYSGAKTALTEDYVYDANGNLVKDLNKDLVAYSGANGIVYNHLNLPSEITVREQSGNKGTIRYTYDASGIKLQKTITAGSSTRTTLYVSGFEYQNDTLQMAQHEEGRIRVSDTVMVYDYFVKDHLGNTRVVLTGERKQDGYPPASMEPGASLVENALYENIDSTRSPLPAGYPEDSYTSPNDYVAKLNASGGKKIGPAILLKVMAGDSIHIRCNSWYRLNGSNPGSPVSPLGELLYSLSKGISVAGGGKLTMQELSGTLLPAGVGDLLNDRSSGFDLGKPKAYLSWVLLDEQFKYVSGSSGFEQVGEDTVLTTWTKSNLPVQKNGYLYVYTGNESAIDVFFDNLQVTHVRGPILEETHYYPFGLTMAGISSKAAGKLENKKKFVSQELDDDLGLNWYQFRYRNHDPQIGRFIEIDPLASDYVHNSTYTYAENKPINGIDLEGLEYFQVNTEGALSIARAAGSKRYTDKEIRQIGKGEAEGMQKAAPTALKITGITAITLAQPEIGIPLIMTELSGMAGYPVPISPSPQAFATSEVKAAIQIEGTLTELTPSIKPTALNSIDEVKAASNVVKSETGFVVTEGGTTIPIPKGASGPIDPKRGSGMVYDGGSGGHGMDKRVSGVRIMDANSNQGRRVNYMNSSGQTVDPKTGKTIANNDPRGHLPIKN